MINKTITQLDLSHNRIGNSGACQIGKFLLHTKILTHLDLGDNNIHYQGSRYISQGLKLNKSLKVLSLLLNRIDDKGGMKFCQDLKEHNTTLKEINLRGNSLEGLFARALAELILDTNLIKIDIACNFIEKKDAISIYESLKDNPNIIELDIRNNKIKDAEVEEEINEIVTKSYLASVKIPYIKRDYDVNLNLDQKEDTAS
jgi:Ran GTPase-activating protein (RanGAP) involved in mRNA processing and transport